MFSDQPGPYRQRLRQLVLASLAAGLAALVGFLIGGELLPILLATAACGFFGGLLVVFGTDTARVGMTSMILLVITASTPTTLGAALGGAVLIFAGGLLHDCVLAGSMAVAALLARTPGAGQRVCRARHAGAATGA